MATRSSHPSREYSLSVHCFSSAVLLNSREQFVAPFFRSIGFVVGIVLSTVLFSIIDSSVCAVIVCFAGSPVEFHRNHPQLSLEMRQAWKEVWPGSVDMDNTGANAGAGKE